MRWRDPRFSAVGKSVDVAAAYTVFCGRDVGLCMRCRGRGHKNPAAAATADDIAKTGEEFPLSAKKFTGQ